MLSALASSPVLLALYVHSNWLIHWLNITLPVRACFLYFHFEYVFFISCMCLFFQPQVPQSFQSCMLIRISSTSTHWHNHETFITNMFLSFYGYVLCLPPTVLQSFQFCMFIGISSTSRPKSSWESWGRSRGKPRPTSPTPMCLWIASSFIFIDDVGVFVFSPASSPVLLAVYVHRNE